MNATTVVAINAAGEFFSVEKMEAHRRGLRHLAVSVFVFCGEELLLQRRALGKYHSELLWANTCCTHPDWGESIEACAHRRLGEEMGMQLPLRRVGSLDYRTDVGGGLCENERVHFFVGEYTREERRVAPDPCEVIDVRWMKISDLYDDIHLIPSIYASWLRIYLQRAEETGIEALQAIQAMR